MDVDRLARDPDHARQIEAAIRAATGLAPDFSDCRTPQRHDLAAVPYRKVARTVIDALGVREAIYGSGASLLLYGKLATAFAALSPDAPGLGPRIMEGLKRWSPAAPRRKARA